MDNENIIFVKTHPDAVLPTKKYRTDSGYDISAVEDVVIPARGSAVIPTGLKMGYIPKGYWIKIENRSSMGFKYKLSCHAGILDNGYRGDLGVMIYNHSDVDHQVKKGDRIAQLIVYELHDFEAALYDDVDVFKRDITERGEKGFGSSGR